MIIFIFTFESFSAAILIQHEIDVLLKANVVASDSLSVSSQAIE